LSGLQPARGDVVVGKEGQGALDVLGGGWLHCNSPQQFGVWSSQLGGRTLWLETHQIFPSVPGELSRRVRATKSR
jgi:hypothetical protein